MCCTSRDICVTDSITTWYFDRKPFRSGYCLYCIPMTCCGPPVIFSRKPMCCCIDMSNCYGQIILTTPHSCCGLKTFCCFGTPCYVSGALPLTNGLKDADVFLSKLKGAVDAYRVNNNLPEKEMAVFTIVNDNIGATGATNKVAASS
jgi:hypothetical protein